MREGFERQGLPVAGFLLVEEAQLQGPGKPDPARLPREQPPPGDLLLQGRKRRRALRGPHSPPPNPTPGSHRPGVGVRAARFDAVSSASTSTRARRTDISRIADALGQAERSGHGLLALPSGDETPASPSSRSTPSSSRKVRWPSTDSPPSAPGLAPPAPLAPKESLRPLFGAAGRGRGRHEPARTDSRPGTTSCVTSCGSAGRRTCTASTPRGGSVQIAGRSFPPHGSVVETAGLRDLAIVTVPAAAAAGGRRAVRAAKGVGAVPSASPGDSARPPATGASRRGCSRPAGGAGSAWRDRPAWGSCTQPRAPRHQHLLHPEASA